MTTSASPKHPLPDGWSAPEAVEDTIVAAGLTICRAGVASVSPDGEEVTGSAAAVADGPAGADVASVSARAWFELLERAAIAEAIAARASSGPYALLARSGEPLGSCTAGELFPESDVPSTWRYARSNGVAIHRDWERACERALWELTERDHVLAAWQGVVRPERIVGGEDALRAATEGYDWSAWAFSTDAASFAPGVEVVGVFGFPSRADAPLALGFAARPDRRTALDDAAREAVQILGFLWGEDLPPVSDRTEPTAMGHLDFHQAREHHALVRSWLAGAHEPHGGSASRCSSGLALPAGADVAFVDLTPEWLSGSFRVVKAVSPSARPLLFGDSPLTSHLPSDRRIHLIA